MKGIRARVLISSLAVLVAVLVGWAVLMVQVFLATIAASARTQGEALADSVVQALRAEPPDTVVRPAGGDVDLTMQILDAEGRVLATSLATATRPLTHSRPAPGELKSWTVARLPGIEESRFVVTAAGATGPRGEPLTVVVATPVHVESGVLHRILVVGVGGAAVIVAIAVLLIGWSVGRALGAVERMRRDLAAIGPPTGRVSVPDTGDELTRLGETMNQLLGRLAAAQQTQRTLVSDAGHELRSPVATLRAVVDVADPDSPSWAAAHEVVSGEVRRLEHLVDDLLTLSRLDARVLPLNLVDCDLDDLVVEATRRVATVSRVPIEVSVEPVRVSADPQRLDQVLRNLVDNAVRHAAAVVRVGLTHQGSWGVVCVDNDGSAIPEDQRERVFERFVRLDEGRQRDTGGSGLGLAIAADLARAQGGSIRCGESPEGWCRFELRLPAGPPHGAESR